jgi:hyaluronan synthase
MPIGALALILLIALLVSNLLRHVLAALVKLSMPDAGLRKDYTFEPTVSVLLPCYNEGQTVYDTIASIAASNYPLHKMEIIAIDDCSVDDSFEWMLKAKQEFRNLSIRAARNPENSGKARTVCRALKQAGGEIVLSIDSDCIFDPNAVRELVVCFCDPKIGGVGGAVGVRNVSRNTATKIQTFVYYTNFRLIKALENLTQSVICISGCMFATRRSLMLELEPIVRERAWFGIPVNDGEDRFLTHQILLRGYGTVINTAAQCWTTVPESMSTLFKQQVRWQRSGVRDFILTLRTLPWHVRTVHPNGIYSMFFPTLAAITSILVIVLFPSNNIPFWVAPTVLVSYAAGAAIFHGIIRSNHPEQAVVNPLTLATFAVWIVAGRLIEVIALLTLDSQDWGTRAKSEPGQAEGLGLRAVRRRWIPAAHSCLHWLTRRSEECAPR